MHSTIQNEIMKVMTLKIIWEVAEKLQNVNFYSITCYKASDSKIVSQLALCLLWVDNNLYAHNELIGLKNMSTNDADIIGHIQLLHYQLEGESGPSKCERMGTEEMGSYVNASDYR